MIFDSTMLAAIASELKTLTGSRLRDLWLAEAYGEPGASNEPRALYLAFAAGTLVIDTHPQRARLHLTTNPPHAAVTPTPFIEAARKTLRGAKLATLEQPGFDRVLRFSFVTRDAIGDVRRRTLVAELMERRSNIILLDEDEVIIDALHRLPPFLNRARTVLPHRPYLPPPGGKTNPLDVNDWAAFFRDHPAQDDPANLTALLRQSFNGISPLTYAFMTKLVRDAMLPAATCEAYFANAREAREGSFSPVLCGGQPYPFAIDDNCEPAPGSLSELIEAQLDREMASFGIERVRSQLLAHLARQEKKLEAQREDVEKSLRHAAEAEIFKAQGELLLANLPAVEEAARQGRDFVELSDAWHGGGRMVRIPIEPKWPAADNATRCFNRYKRAQKLAADAPRRSTELAAEAETLSSLRARAESATTQQQLEALARDAGYDSTPRKVLSRTREQQQAARPENKLRRSEVDGWTLFMGRSALENQLLLSKVARPSDIWMHVRGMPSAHVLIKAQKGKEPPPRVLQEAGRRLATAGRSAKRSEGEVVEIIYTPAKWVRAVKGSPGKVTLQRFATLNVKV